MTSHQRSRTIATLALALAAASWPAARPHATAVGAQAAPNRIQAGDFLITYDGTGVTGLSNPNDRYKAQVLAPAGRLGAVVKYRVEGGDWFDIFQSEPKAVASPDGRGVTYTNDVSGTVLKSTQTFRCDGASLDWTIEVSNRMAYPVQIGDFAAAIPWRSPGGEDPEAIFERSWTKHQFISGHGSFVYFVRPNGEPPYLMMTPRSGTHLEYSTAGGGRNAPFLAFVHSALTGGGDTRGTWRQPHTDLALGPAGAANASVQYGFRFRWANSYDQMRQVLYDEGLFDVRVVPGMTVPEDLDARFALHTKAQIEAVQPEFPARTTITDLGERKPGYRMYLVAFRQLGENRLTIVHDGGRQTHLEFFVTEPLETLIKKRTRFITTRQQHRDPAKWYDGLYSVYDMRAKVLRGPDDTDGFDYWWGYVVAADDPVLGKAPLVASKNVRFPDAAEIASVEYYLEHFVWGKLQRTDRETPYPYGLHGVPNWRETRDPVLRARSSNANLDKMKIWRSYDYPHMVMLYFHMYEIASKYPALVHYLDAPGYLERAYQTARAYFTYPYEILPWYETYKWGCYNELVILDVIDALERTGARDKAAWLRAEWEKKVKYFVYDDKYPFRSEYAIDRTAFESSYALAKYGATNDMAPDKDLWFDKNKQRWYSHPVVKRQDARALMDRQLMGGLAVRGWLETAYYLLGADFTGSSDTGSLSYMANMGGWGILDYAQNFAAVPWDWLQLGYASYLSSWALMNTGQPETNYGFWFPGPENDGASGWQFMTAKYGRAWIRKDVPRGPWHYDGEIDLGYGAGLRMAATIVADDPLFGLIAYGGTLGPGSAATYVGPGSSPRLRSGQADPGHPAAAIVVVPRDGLRQRFAAVLQGPGGPRKLRVELDRDGFAAGGAITLDRALDRVAFTIENRTADRHRTALRLAVPAGATYEVRVDGKRVALQPSGNLDYPLRADLDVGPQPPRVEIVRRPPTKG
jgi:hypothetical protein